MSRVEEYLSELSERRAKKRGVRRFAVATLATCSTILLLTAALGDQSGLGITLLNSGFWISMFFAFASVLWGIGARNRLAVIVGITMAVATWWNWNRPVLFSSPSQPKNPTFSILSYNIADNEPEFGKGQLMLGLIESVRADVMIFQEASIIANDPVFRKCLRGYNTALTQQVAIATKADVGEVVQIQEIDFEPTKPASKGGTPGRYGIIATVKWREKLFYIVGFQLRPRFAKGDPTDPLAFAHYQMVADYRARQIAKVKKLIAKLRGPVLIAADLDTPPFGPSYNFFASSFSDAWPAGGSGTGATFMHERTQYVFFSNHWRINSVSTPHSEASTHLPVFAKFELIRDASKAVKIQPDPNADGVLEDPDTFVKKPTSGQSESSGGSGTPQGSSSGSSGGTGSAGVPTRTRWAPLGEP